MATSSCVYETTSCGVGSRRKMSDSEDELERYVFEVAWEVANKGMIPVLTILNLNILTLML